MTSHQTSRLLQLFGVTYGIRRLPTWSHRVGVVDFDHLKRIDVDMERKRD